MLSLSLSLSLSLISLWAEYSKSILDGSDAALRIILNVEEQRDMLSLQEKTDCAYLYHNTILLLILFKAVVGDLIKSTSREKLGCRDRLAVIVPVSAGSIYDHML